jgi:predicted nucleic acid-binding protein
MNPKSFYIDTSVATKLYIKEADSYACVDIVRGATLVSSRLLFCEFRSALLGKESRGEISRELRVEAWEQFVEHTAAGMVRFSPLDDVVAQDAADLLEELHPHVALRPLDALHIATFLSIDGGPLFTKDLRMLSAASHLGLAVAS